MSLDFSIYIPAKPPYVNYANEYTEFVPSDDLEMPPVEVQEVFTVNITHNLTEMASAVNIYNGLWRPNYTFDKITPELLSKIEAGHRELYRNPEKYRKYDASNGWGTYDDFLPVVAKIMYALHEYPIGWVYRST